LYDSTEREASEIPEESIDDGEIDMPKNDGNVQLISRALNSKMSILKHENIEVEKLRQFRQLFPDVTEE
jgi:hypothetical protein